MIDQNLKESFFPFIIVIWLKEWMAMIPSITPWNLPSLKTAWMTLCHRLATQQRDGLLACRKALTGTIHGPSILSVMDLLGPERVQHRIRRSCT
jgi:hypothetical protein